MTRKIGVSVLVFLLFFPVFTAQAIQWTVGDLQFGINAYLDLEYTYMEKMPMKKSDHTMIMGSPMGVNNSFDQNHLNILFDAEMEKFKLHINLDSRHSYSSKEGIGHFEVEEAYGEYGFYNIFNIKAGYMLAPFGIYNDVRYITPLFATVVLPFMYELPSNYKREPLYPHNVNIMTYGTIFAGNADIIYSIYAGNGERKDDGTDTNRDKLVGGRIKVTIFDEHDIGFSSYTTLDQKDSEHSSGRHAVYAGDITIRMPIGITLEGEYLFDSYLSRDRKDRTSYYVRASYHVAQFTPFVGFDYFSDYEDILFKKGMSKISVGTGYEFSANITAKVEYHYHWYGDDSGLPKGTDTINMIRTSLIFIM